MLSDVLMAAVTPSRSRRGGVQGWIWCREQGSRTMQGRPHVETGLVSRPSILRLGSQRAMRGTFEYWAGLYFCIWALSSPLLILKTRRHLMGFHWHGLENA